MATPTEAKVWFITGSSSGFGRALAEVVLNEGEIVVLTARNTETIKDLEAKFSGRALAVKLDVTRTDEVEKAVSEAIAKFGRIDVLVNNAGFGIIGAIVGGRSAKQVEGVVGAAEFCLSEGEINEIETFLNRKFEQVGV